MTNQKSNNDIVRELAGPIEAWLRGEGPADSEAVRDALGHYLRLVQTLAENHRKASQLLKELSRALGITSSSERRKSGDPIGAKGGGCAKHRGDAIEKLQFDIKRSSDLATWHRKLAKRHKKNEMDGKKKLDSIENIALTEVEEAEVEREHQEYLVRLEKGDGPSSELKSSQETLLTGCKASITESEATVSPPKLENNDKIKVLATIHEERERYDFSLNLERITVKVEKRIFEDEDGERRVISGSTRDLGPPKYAVTWGFLAETCILSMLYAMPLNRLAIMLSSILKNFTSVYLARLLQYTAQRYVSVYLTLFESMADSAIFMGDDTSSRVLEVRKYFAQKTTDDPPWKSYKTADIAQATFMATENDDVNLGVIIARELGFEFPRRNAPGKTKVSLNTTAVSGRSVADDPRSRVIFYRTHLGGFGNLLERLLKIRSPNFREVITVTDLATVNLVNDSDLLSRFELRCAGCTSHARRPYALYEDDDPESCAAMLHYFKGLFIYEHALDLHGRNTENVSAVRDVDSRQLWGYIKELAEYMQKRWSPKTKLGEASNYIIRNFDKLTAYLDDPRIEISNNFSERVLRMEKKMQDNSLFRSTLEGRFAVDVLRTILQTAIAANVPVKDYMLYVLKAHPYEVETAPENFTPYAYAQKIAANAANLL